jgi:hypothetical protein
LVGDGPFLSFFNGSDSPSTKSLTLRPLLFRNKKPDRPRQMLGGDTDIPFSKDLGDPLNEDPAPVGFQDLFLAFSPGASGLAFGISYSSLKR